jgi:hypothetical protein
VAAAKPEAKLSRPWTYAKEHSMTIEIKIQAFDANDDKEVEFADHNAYYKKILENAFGSDFVATENPGSKNSSNGEFSVGHLKTNIADMKIPKILRAIHDAEQKYYYKCIELDERGKKTTLSHEGEEILTTMSRVTAAQMMRILKPKAFNQDDNPLVFASQLKIQISKGSDKICCFRIGPGKEGKEEVLACYVNNNATALYIDHTSSSTALRFGFRDQSVELVTSVEIDTINRVHVSELKDKKAKINQNHQFDSKLVRKEIPRFKMLESLLDARRALNKGEKDGSQFNAFLKAWFAAMDADTFLSKIDFAQYEKYLKENIEDQVWVPLKLVFHDFLNHGKDGYKLTRVAAEETWESAELESAELPSDFKKSDFEKFLGRLKGGNDQEDENWAKVRFLYESAVRRSAQLPPKYRCFYYVENGALKSFLSDANLGVGRTSGGYAMRADRPDEFSYKWKYRPSPAGSDNRAMDEQKAIARLTALAAGLDIGSLVQDSASSMICEANTPRHDRIEKKTKTKEKEQSNSPGMSSYVEYYKECSEGNARVLKINNTEKRNFPKNNVRIPRLPEAASFKTELRVRVKGEDNSGAKYATGPSASPREDAGAVMANALRDFNIYEKMKIPLGGELNGITLAKITNTKLPASSFAQYLLINDKDVERQWRKDNGLDGTQQGIELRTNQEWCHLLGHGDGGKEELGNFVSGSKHCNTEQLAIEVGQRRIIQNDMKVEVEGKTGVAEIPEVKRKKFKAKISAYLMPNGGAGLRGSDEAKLDDEAKLKEFRKKAKALKATNVSNDTAQELFRKVSKKYRETSGKTGVGSQAKKELLGLRRGLQNYVCTLPLGRWMRYKIYYDGVRIFDHVYDCQSQSFDLREAKILDFTVERVLYEALEIKADADRPPPAKKAKKSDTGVAEPEGKYRALYYQKLLERTEKLVAEEKKARSA